MVYSVFLFTEKEYIHNSEWVVKGLESTERVLWYPVIAQSMTK